MTINEAYQNLKAGLQNIYVQKEAENIAGLVIEKITGLNKINRILSKHNKLKHNQIKLLEKFSDQLLKHKPVQYVLNEAWFDSIKFYVDKNVLIPRPETEELVQWIISDVQSANHILPLKILDIGTGSGCIAVTLKKKLTDVEMFALDISEAALKVALKNATVNNADVSFFKTDITQLSDTKDLGVFNIIVSNPPYITKKESAQMNLNVLSYEPYSALFVPDEDPLLYYRSISDFAISHLEKKGCLYFEINESFEKEISQLLYNKRFKSIEIKKDLQGKSRMIKAVL